MVVSSLSQTDGVVRVVFATMALGMGVGFKSLDYIIPYGAPCSLEDYIQESGRAGRDHQPEFTGNQEVRDYLENTELCRRFMLLKYFDPAVAMTLGSRDNTVL
ncbi:hypothetical protein EMCRGX_G000909 [Ephydatia muelleri]